VEAVDKRYSGIFCDLRFDVFAKRCRSQHAEILAFALALLVGFDGSDQKVISESRALYFSSRVRVAMILLAIYTAIISTAIKVK